MGGQAMIRLEIPPVGVRLLDAEAMKAYDGVTLFSGVSYCEAVSGASSGMELLLGPGSIRVCKWAPVVLGLKPAENDFERTIDPHVDARTAGVYMAPLHLYRKGTVPDVVIVRARPADFARIIGVLGWEAFINPEPYRQDHTALHAFREKPPAGLPALAIRSINGALHVLNRSDRWHAFTAFLFKSYLVTKVFDRFITRYMANMSMCRNSLAVPYLQGRANISYFCTGGIAWGKNDPRNMTSGFPYALYGELEQHLEYPGKTREDRMRRN